jgi:hypothetical protein
MPRDAAGRKALVDLGRVWQFEGGAVQADQAVITIKGAGQARRRERPCDAPVQLGQRRHAKATARLGNGGLGGECEDIAAPAQPTHAFQQTAQHLAVGSLPVQRQGHDVVDDQPRRERAVTNACSFGVSQDRIDQRRRHCGRQHPERHMIAEPHPSRQRRHCPRHDTALRRP